MKRRAFLLGAGLTLVGCVGDSCDQQNNPVMDPVPGDGGLPTEPTPVDPGRRAPSPIGYSNVATLNANEAEAVFGVGLTLVQAEALPFGLGPESFDITRLRGIAETARRHGGTFLITLLNWNGLPQQQVSEAWYRDRIRQIVAEVGVANVWFEGISEPGSGKHGFANRQKSIRFQQIALAEWPGVDVQNGDDVRADIRDVHYCGRTRLEGYQRLLTGVRRGSSTLHSTDCTPILASTLNEAQVREVTRAAVASRARFIAYDTSNAPAGNENVVRWMSEEL